MIVDNPCSLQHVGVQFRHYLVVHRHTSIQRRGATLASMLRRLARTDDQPTFRGMLDKCLRKETGSIEHNRIVLAQEFLVARVEVVFPQVATEPSSTYGP